MERCERKVHSPFGNVAGKAVLSQKRCQRPGKPCGRKTGIHDGGPVRFLQEGSLESVLKGGDRIGRTRKHKTQMAERLAQRIGIRIRRRVGTPDQITADAGRTTTKTSQKPAFMAGGKGRGRFAGSTHQEMPKDQVPQGQCSCRKPPEDGATEDIPGASAPAAAITVAAKNAVPANNALVMSLAFRKPAQRPVKV